FRNGAPHPAHLIQGGSLGEASRSPGPKGMDKGRGRLIHYTPLHSALNTGRLKEKGRHDMTAGTDEKILKRIPGEILALASILAVGALLLFDAGTGLFVLLGGGLSALGFIWLRQSVARFLRSGKAHAVRTALFLYGLRLVLIIAIFFIIILFFSGRIYAFAAGFSTVIPVFLFEALAALSQLKQWKP
ncbi:MAG: ATP synthase subunit I, partial [Thermodesulfobacteriota bacterium]